MGGELVLHHENVEVVTRAGLIRSGQLSSMHALAQGMQAAAHMHSTRMTNLRMCLSLKDTHPCSKMFTSGVPKHRNYILA